jgi:hypothetical protein
VEGIGQGGAEGLGEIGRLGLVVGAAQGGRDNEGDEYHELNARASSSEAVIGGRFYPLLGLLDCLFWVWLPEASRVTTIKHLCCNLT